MTRFPHQPRSEGKTGTACDGCRFADWLRTKSGGLHPSGYGKCRFPVPDEPAIPMWAYDLKRQWKYFAERAAFGQSIQRKEDQRGRAFEACATRETGEYTP